MCSICLHAQCPPQCPNFIAPNVTHYCSICKEGIYDGEEYIENNGDFRHYDCFYGIRELLEWLGYKVKTMDKNDY